MDKTQLSYCADVVRSYDPDRYFLSMLCSPVHREALWALFAFNHEIAKTRQVVSETQLGLIRLQWWRERIEGVYERGEVVEHEVIKPLAQAIETYDLPRGLFDKLIYAREFDLEDVLPSNMEGLLNYADFTTTPLNTLVHKVIGGKEVEPVQTISMNYALVGILRSVPHFACARRCLLPEDLMRAHGQSVNQLYESKRCDDFSCVVEAVAGHIVEGVVCESRFFRVMQRLSEVYLQQIYGVGYDVFDARMSREPAFKAFRVLTGWV